MEKKYFTSEEKRLAKNLQVSKYRKTAKGKATQRRYLDREETKQIIRDRDVKHRKTEKHKKYISDYYLKSRYGITLHEYNKLYDDQNGCCKICKTPQSELKEKLNLDHDHVSNKVRALLCVRCNVGFGNFKDDTGLLLEAINYLNYYDLSKSNR